MIYFNINIRNPYWGDRFKNIWGKVMDTPWKNKFFEVQITKDSELFRVEFEWTTMQDHAGLRLELGLLGYKLNLTFYDMRHWNYEEQRWYYDNESQGYE